MLFTRIIAVLLFSGTVVQASQGNITYSVVTSLSDPNMSVNVVIDDVHHYPLISEENSILFKGEAPEAQSSYHYVIYTSDKPTLAEAISREPVSENTVNEFFNRSKNTHVLAPLPQIYQPLPVIKRIESDLHMEGHIPTIHLWGNQSEIDRLHDNQLDDIKIKLNMEYIGLNDVQHFEKVKVSLAGRSSSFTPKLSYTVRFTKKSGSRLYGFKNFKLRALDIDSSYIREHIAFSCIKAAGVPATGFSYRRLFINNKPVGLYGFIETFQDPWTADEFANGDEQYQSGELYQGIFSPLDLNQSIVSDLKYLGENLTLYNMGEYKIKAGKDKKNKPQVFEALKEFTKFVNQTTAETSVEEWEDHLDTTGFIRSMALEDLLGFSDAYMTLSDNYYLYNDPNQPGRMIYIPSDLDMTIGFSIAYLDSMLSGDYSKHPGFSTQPLTRQLFSNPVLLQQYKDTILKLAKELIHPSVIIPRIDSLVDMIRTDVEWDQSLPRLGKNLEGSLHVPTAITFPPEIRVGNDVYQNFPFEQEVNGPMNITDHESVKGFIRRKIEAVLTFFDQN